MGAKLYKEQAITRMCDMEVGQLAVLLAKDTYQGDVIQRCAGNIAIFIGTDNLYDNCDKNSLEVRILKPGTTIVLTE